jgi:hypothetical protein
VYREEAVGLKRRSRIREGALFLVRFFVIAVPCLLVWWRFLLPHYLWLVGQFAGKILNEIKTPLIESLSVDINPDSILNTETMLLFHLEGGGKFEIDYAPMVNSLPPFIVLVLATGGLGLFRRVAILLVGSVIMFLGQGIFLVGQYYFFDQIASKSEIPTAFGQFWLTAPFILWVLLAYWDRIGRILGDDGGEEGGATGS